MSRKMKIVIYSLTAVGIAAVAYYAFTSTHKAALTIVMPILLALAPCIIMCTAIGGSMWFVQRRGNKNTQSCGCSYHNDSAQARTKDKTKSFAVFNDQFSNLKISQSNRKK